MATYAWTRTRNQVIDTVLRKLGIIGQGQTAKAPDTEIVADAIDARLKELHRLGVLWWKVSGAQTSVTVTATVATATIGAADYLFPVSMMLTDSTEQLPLEIIGHRQYHAIPDKTLAGTPEKVFIDGATCRFWPVSNLTTTAKLTYQGIIADSENVAALDLPVSTLRAFAALVAGDLIDEYSVPDPKAGRLLAGQAQAMRDIRMLNVERTDAARVTAEYF